MMVRVCHMGATFSLLSFIFAWPIWASDVQEALKTNADWQSFGGVPSGGQYSALNQININNVGNLERAWVAHTGDVVKGSAVDGGSSFQASPIFWNDTLYICTPMNRTIAVNAKTGEEVWAFDGFSTLSSEMPKFAANCRGVAFWSDANAKLSGELCSSRVIQPDVLGNLYSIDAQTGQLCSDFGDGGRLNLNEFEYFGEGGIFFASPPAVFDDYLIVGGGVGDNMYADAADGIVRGLDVRTGQQRWSFNPIPKELSDSTGGANVWSMFSIDQESEIVYLPTSSPSVDPFGGLRHDPIPYANSLVALNARTGEVVWHQQLVHHDVFDYDLPAQPILIDIKKSDGQIVEAVVQITKMGFIFVFDRHTGEAVFPIEERAVPGSDIQGEQVSLTQPFPLVPEPFARQGVTEDDIWGLTFLDRGWCSSKYKRLRNDGFYTPPSLEGTLQMPSALGGGNWGGAAVDPQSNTLIVKTQNLATIIKLIPADINEVRPLGPPIEFLKKPLNGTPFRLDGEFFMSPLGIPCTAPPWGELVAIDLSTGQHLWRSPLGRLELGPIKTPRAWGSPNVGGPIVTAGGLIFIGAGMESSFRALNVKNGEQLWEDSGLPAPAMAVPITYQVDGVQYIVVAAGGNSLAETRQSDALVAYKLADN